ncbi:RHS repeat-associated core domain protein, partial [Saprospira grandis DSM 2844]
RWSMTKIAFIWRSCYLYGSARLGILEKTLALRYRDESGAVGLPAGSLLKTTLAQSSYHQLELGRRRYELSNHLGNVLATVSDKSLGQDSSQTGQADYYLAQVSSASLYYPFGWEMPGRKFVSGEGYRFGFNGKEDDRDWGTQNIQDYGFRLYNPSIGKFLSVDPLSPDYPWYTPYQFAGNKPIWAVDLDGLEEKIVTLYTKEDGSYDRYKTKVVLNKDKVIKEGTQRVAYTHLSIVQTDGTHKKYLIREKLSDDGYLEGTSVYPSARYNFNDKDPNYNSNAWDRVWEDPGCAGLFSGEDNIIDNRNNTAPEIWQERADWNAVVELSMDIASNFAVVGRWMSVGEYNKMLKTGRVQEGSGGVTYVSRINKELDPKLGFDGPSTFRRQAPKGSVYVEFEVKKADIVQAGQANWGKLVGPNANLSSRIKLKSQGGTMLPEVKNIQIKERK